jgi:hypothetical protein
LIPIENVLAKIHKKGGMEGIFFRGGEGCEE